MLEKKERKGDVGPRREEMFLLYSISPKGGTRRITRFNFGNRVEGGLARLYFVDDDAYAPETFVFKSSPAESVLLASRRLSPRTGTNMI